MPKIYNRKCNECGKDYKGVGKNYCSTQCAHNSKTFKDNMSIVKKKNPTKYWLGKKRNIKDRKKMSLARIGVSPWNKGKNIQINTGRTHFKKGNHYSPTTEFQKGGEGIKGERHWNWQGGKTPKNKLIRESVEFELWRQAVFARDEWTCKKCRFPGRKLNSHHIKNFAQYPELRFAIDNGITLCKEHHQDFHKIYGKKDNNQEQINEYLTI